MPSIRVGAFTISLAPTSSPVTANVGITLGINRSPAGTRSVTCAGLAKQRKSHRVIDAQYGTALTRGRRIAPAPVRNPETHAADAAGRARLLHGTTVSSRTDANVFLGEYAPDEIANVAMIIDDENARLDLHDANTIEHVRGA
jgi:hypothetical protein